MNPYNLFSVAILLLSLVLNWYALCGAVLCIRWIVSTRSYKHDLFRIMKFLKQIFAKSEKPVWNYTAPANSGNTDVCILILRHLNDPRTARLVCKKTSRDVILMKQWNHKRASHIAHYAKYWSPGVNILPDTTSLDTHSRTVLIHSDFSLRFQTFAQWDGMWVCFHLESPFLVHLPAEIRHSNVPLLKMIAFTRDILYFQKIDKGLFQ